MNQNTKEIEVLNNKNLTNPIINVNPKDLPKYWDRDYINYIIYNIDQPSHKMFVRFLWMTGLRVSEAINIIKSDIDFKNYTIRVKWLKNRKYNYRYIPIHPNLKDIMEVYSAKFNQADLIFPFSRQRAWAIMKRYFKGHPHQLRHSFAVNWLRCGGDITILSRILGHSKIQTTMEYLKIVPIDQGKELIKIQFT